MKEVEQHHYWAVQPLLIGEKPEAISASLSRSKAWLYKCVERLVMRTENSPLVSGLEVVLGWERDRQYGDPGLC